MLASERARNVRAARLAARTCSSGASHALRSLRCRLAHADPARAAEITPEIDPRASLGVVQQWIYNYRAKPDYAHVPAAVRVLFHSQTFKEPENAGIYLGFIAGAIGSNPAKAEQLVTSFFPVPPEDEWVIVRAIAYSGLPDWRNLLRRVAPRMPARRVMIDSYLAGKLPTLADIPLEETKPGHDGQAAWRVHAKSLRQGRQEAEHDADLRQQSGSAGYAVGLLFRDRLACSDPAHHADAALEQEPRHRRQADGRQHGALHACELRGPRRRTCANFSAANCRTSRSRSRCRSPKWSRPPTPCNSARVRKDALAAVEELKTKGSDARRNLDFWGQVGVGAVALGCVSAAALGQVAIGIPCVIGGSASQGLLSFWEKQQ